MKLQICKFDYWKIFWCKQSVCAVLQMMLTLCVCVSLHSVCWWSGRSWSGWSPLPARSRGDSRWTGLGETPTTEGDKKQHEVTSVTEEQVEITIRKKEREDETRLWMRETGWRGKYTETVSFSRTLKTVNSELDLRCLPRFGSCGVHATNWLNFPNNYHWGALEQDTKASKPQKTLVVVRSYWVLHVIQTTSESKLVCNFGKKKSLQSTKERERK